MVKPGAVTASAAKPGAVTASVGRKDRAPQVGTAAQAGTARPPALHADHACARAWAALTAAHALTASRLSTELSRTCGMSINDFEILLMLEQVPPPGLRLGELCTTVPLTQPALSRAVARLGNRGWLRRASATDDRRGVLIAIAPAGQDVLRRAVPVHARTIRESLIDPLTPGAQDRLVRALNRIAAS